jgi:hypothetical protein
MRHLSISGVLKVFGALGAACALLALGACSGSKFEKSLLKGCAEGGNSSKTCQCAADKLGETYDLNNIEEFMERKGMPLQTITRDYASALHYCIDKHGR